MIAASVPANFPIPFANSAGAAYIGAVPTASQISITPGAASLTDGFPPLCFTPVSAGGVPPFGKDFNGLLNQITSNIQWYQAGGIPTYNSTFSTAIGGYPNGSVLQSADQTGFWRSTVDNNLTNPDTGGAGWLPHFFYGTATVALTGSNTTLTATQYAKPIIILTGALTASLNLVFPAIVGQWLISNQTTGAYTITAKTAAGTGAALASGIQSVWGDGSNIYSANPTGISQSGSVTAGHLAKWSAAGVLVDGGADGTAANLNASSTNIGAGVSSEYAYAGNPNGNLAGVAAVAGASPADRCWDTTHKSWWICTTTGSTSTAVWQVVGSMAPVSVASASTVDLGAQASTSVTITGTTTITSFGSSAPAGQIYTATFSGVLTLTYNAASLILPGAANITTAAGDVAQFLSLGSGNWRCIDYQTASGQAVVSSAVQAPIQSISASVAANALTVGLNPTTLQFRNASLTNGIPVVQAIGSALSLTVPSGATLGTLNSSTQYTANELALLVAYNGGSPVLCVVNMAGGANLDETALISPTTISSGATSASTIYSASAVAANSPFRVVGYITLPAQTTAGTWATGPTLVQGQGGQAMAAMQSLGFGQTWQSVTRALGTTYYNPTGRPILVQAVTYNNDATGSSITLSVNGIVISQTGLSSFSGGGIMYSTLSAIVPPGASYVFTSGSASYYYIQYCAILA